MRPPVRWPATVAALCAVLLLAPSLGCETAGAARGGGGSGGSGGAAVAPELVLGRFVAALEGGRWAEAQGLLSARWRGAYTPPRLAADYAGAGPLAREAAAHVRSALAAGAALQVGDGRAVLPLGDGRAVLPLGGGRAVLVAEAAGWRVDALE